MLKDIDRWTTIDGEWEVSTKRYSITKEALQKWGTADIPGKGAAHHIFVRVPMWATHISHIVEFNTEDRKNKTEQFIVSGKWTSFPIFQAYNPDAGEVGPWHVRIDGEKVAEGIGLPFGWHVSTFLVVEDVEPEIELPGGPEVGSDTIQLIVNGVEVWSNR